MFKTFTWYLIFSRLATFQGIRRLILSLREKSDGFFCEDQVEADGRPIYWDSGPLRVHPELWGLRGEPAGLQDHRATFWNFLEEFYQSNMALQECLSLQAVPGEGPKRSLTSKKTQNSHCEGNREKNYFEQHPQDQ
jgi:hypothetical protein